MSDILHISNLTKFYKQEPIPALNKLSFAIKKGEIFGLLGPNGAGKTTAISIISGWLSFNSGLVEINGCSIGSNASICKKTLGIVPQDIALYPTLTARENLTFYGRVQNISGKELKNRINAQLEILGLIKSADKQVRHFSGGMKRRINLIAGILHKPSLLLLDEPTVGIDVQSRSAIMDYLARLNDEGISILYTSHHLAEAEQFCNRVAIIDKGEKIVEGSPAEIIKKDAQANSLEDVFIHLTGRELRD